MIFVKESKEYLISRRDECLRKGVDALLRGDDVRAQWWRKLADSAEKALEPYLK